MVRNRLETYYQQTEPVVDYYKSRQTVYDIDGNGDADVVAKELFRKLDTLARKK